MITLENYSVEIPELKKEFNEKFVLVKETISDTEKRWAIVCIPIDYHVGILKSLYNSNRKVTIYGGGRLLFSNRTLTAYDESQQYGVASPEIVNKIMNDWTDGIGVEFENRLKEQEQY